MIALPSKEHSLWRDAYAGPYFPKLDGPKEVDVVVIGAGITGLTTAYLLKQRGLKVAVIDKDTVGGGTTGRTTGKVTSQHSLCYAELVEMVGEKAARIYGQANQVAIDTVESIIKKEAIDCDWRRASNFVYTASTQTAQRIKDEVTVAQKLGLPARFTKTLDLPFAVEAAIEFTDQGQFTAQKYLLGLAQAVDGDGSFVFEHTGSLLIHDGTPCKVRTKHGTITSKDIVVASSVPTMPLMARGGYCALEYPTESYIVAAPYYGKTKQMYISPDKSHYSILPVTFGAEPYLLIGGGGHVSGMRLSKRQKFTELAQYAEEHFGIYEITHMWSDRDYMAYDKLPLIGKLYPWSKHVYTGTAYHKWGLSNGTVAGMILTDLITGQHNPWAATFEPQRLRPVRYIPKAVAEQTKQLF